MSSIIKLETFEGDGTQDVKAWLQSFTQWAKFHDLRYLIPRRLMCFRLI